MTSTNPAHHPFIIPPAIKAPLPGGAQTAGEAALHLQQKQLATQLAGGAALSPANVATIPPEGTPIPVPQVDSPAINVNPLMNAHTAAKTGAINFLNNHAQAEYDNLAGQDADPGAAQSGGSLMKELDKVYESGHAGTHTSCYLSGGKKQRKKCGTKRKRTKGLKKKGKEKKKTQRRYKSKKRKLSHKKK